VVIARGKLLQNRFHQPGATTETLLPDLITVDEVINAGSHEAITQSC
jgi:hypothetical protein